MLTLKDYIKKSEPFHSDSAIFISLKKPFKAIFAAAIANALESSFSRAGLSGQGFSAKCFRPTGATRAS